MVDSPKCPECGQGLELGRMAYKHALSCLHLPDSGVDGLRRFADQTPNKDHAKRIHQLMDLAEKGA